MIGFLIILFVTWLIVYTFLKNTRFGCRLDIHKADINTIRQVGWGKEAKCIKCGTEIESL